MQPGPFFIRSSPPHPVPSPADAALDTRRHRAY